MSTIKSSAENLTLNADGANNDIKFQSNGVEKASIDQDGKLTASALAVDNITIDGTEIDLSSGDLTDVMTEVKLMWILAKGIHDIEGIRHAILQDEVGEVSVKKSKPY